MMKTQNYASFFECVDRFTPIEDYEKFIDKNAIFKDPFHEVKGINSIYNIFQKMYKDLEDPSFKVIEVIENKNIAYLKWSFIFKFKDSKKEEEFEGISRVVFNSENKVILHEDFWDAAKNVYEKLPFISILIKFVKNKIRA